MNRAARRARSGHKKIKDLRKSTQGVLQALLECIYENNPVEGLSRDDFVAGTIELLDANLAYIEHDDGCYRLRLTDNLEFVTTH